MAVEPFTTGTKVEVASEEDGFRGAWFEATVVRNLPRLRRYTVEYESLLVDRAVGSKRLRETVEWRCVRPRPPDCGGVGLEVGRVVDAYCNDAWWTGVMANVGGEEGEESYSVYFPSTKETLEFGKGHVRPNREWVDRKWVDSQSQEIHQMEQGYNKDLQDKKQLDLGFGPGSLVEVSSDDEGFLGSWFNALVIKPSGNNTFLVEYADLRTDDGKNLLREAVQSVYIRPAAPRNQVANFKLLEEVEAWHNDGWWIGVISKVLEGNRYMVYFKQATEELEFAHHDLRLHFDWVRGEWMRASQELGF